MSNAIRHQNVSVDGASIHVAESGDADAPAYVLLHGWPESWSSWRPIMELEDNVHFVAIDLPGIGQSTGESFGGSKRRIAGAINQLIHQLELKDAVLVGHDAGGMAAYAYSRQFDHVKRVVIMDTVIPGVEPWAKVLANPYIWHFSFHSVPNIPEMLVAGKQSVYFDYFYGALCPQPDKVDADLRAEHALAYATDASLQAGFDFYRAFQQDVKDNEEFAGWEPCATPLTYVRGAFRENGIEEYANGFQNAGVKNVTTALVADAGHYSAEENPQGTWDAIK